MTSKFNVKQTRFSDMYLKTNVMTPAFLLFIFILPILHQEGVFHPVI